MVFLLSSIFEHGKDWLFPKPAIVWKDYPRYAVISQIAQEHLKLGKDELLNVYYYIEGDLNRLYLIKTTKGDFIVRIPQLNDPYFKVKTEIANLELVAKSTSITVPKILAHHVLRFMPDLLPVDTKDEASLQDGKFEWMLMDRVAGVPPHWRQFDMNQKKLFMEKLADWVHELYANPDCQFSQIGNIYTRDIVIAPESTGYISKFEFEVGRIVSVPFFRNRRAAQLLHRGPFSCSLDWLCARIELILNECEKVIQDAAAAQVAEGHHEKSASHAPTQAIIQMQLAERLLKVLPKLCPPPEIEKNFFLTHNDLRIDNILVDKNTFEVKSIVDWELASVVPAWLSCQPPAIFTRPHFPRREKKPNSEFYRRDEAGQICESYHADVLRWELTQMEKVFLQRMQSKGSDWIAVYESEQASVVRSVEYAIEVCDIHEAGWGRLSEWLDVVEKGEEVPDLVYRTKDYDFHLK